ncbi:hypothetical protein [Hymenobacter jeollabukensis]|uniref:Uncharacterized protein n=1 Tax=Hymenobacter jeollabukensis TaxID=2025313 RepID=A0A5R8WKG8_9BACT|nr:hypothetical protein [Hymenobacter jeollabukensis]TLM89428.1 hypothetical protein FDY95_20355 [Hymenobacter jeollabukensis]
MKKHDRLQLPAFLLLVALILSAGLNCYLLMADHSPLEQAFETDNRMAESELELRLAQAQLAQCQVEQLRKDSVLVSLLGRPHANAVKL